MSQSCTCQFFFVSLQTQRERDAGEEKRIRKNTNYMITIENALRIAIQAHEGQKDLDGKPVILHPLAVGLAGKTREETIAGFLHDVVEDSSYTFESLQGIGVDREIVDVLRLLTHDKSTDYYDYVQHIIDSGNATALAVKRNDLNHNLMRGRAGNHTKQVMKHEKALAMLDNAAKASGEIP